MFAPDMLGDRQLTGCHIGMQYTFVLEALPLTSQTGNREFLQTNARRWSRRVQSASHPHCRRLSGSRGS